MTTTATQSHVFLGTDTVLRHNLTSGGRGYVSITGEGYGGADIYVESREQASLLAAEFAQLAIDMNAAEVESQIADMSKGTAADPDATSYPTDPAATARFCTTLTAALHPMNASLIVPMPEDRRDLFERERDERP